MSYQVIARKWRPQSFDELVGQKHVTQTLLNGLRGGRMAHALLLTGPRGTGKTSTARILAKSLRCPHAKDFVPCNQCSECNDISTGRSINVIEIDGASNNGVDAIRELRDTVSYMPSSGTYKLYIIDEVHMLSTSAFNALLKTLEEPPSHVIFVLATTEVQKIPNTILSRCQRLDFRRISSREVTERLQLICDQEGVEAESEALWMIARQAEGSMRDSQSLLDQVITYSDKRITSAKVVEVLGLTDRSLLIETLKALVARDASLVLKVIERLFSSGFDPKVFAQDLLEELRHLLMVKISEHSIHQIVDLPDTEIEALRQMGSGLSEEDIHLLFDMALKGGNDIPRAQDPRLVLEMVLMRMVAAPRIASLAEWVRSQDGAQGPSAVISPAVAPASPVARPPIRSSSAAMAAAPRATPSSQSPARTQQPETATTSPRSVATPPAAPKAAPTRPVATSGGSLEDRWFQFVQQVNVHNALLAAKLAHVRIIQYDTTTQLVTLAIPPNMKFLSDQLNGTQFKEQLNQFIGQYWESGASLVIQLDEAASKASVSLSPKALEEKRKADQDSAMKRQVENHPLVQSVGRVFNTEIKSIKERP